MNLYRRIIFPQLLDLALSGERIERYRRQLLAHVQGSVLEIGFGTGLNLPCYPEHIRKITGVDPNPGMGSLARRRIASSPIAVDWQVADAQELPFPSQSFDSVVSTWTLCSIPNVAKALEGNPAGVASGGQAVFSRTRPQ
jgi:ubiquinone/menaquinone biosynthesis C-methylase UbiE